MAEKEIKKSIKVEKEYVIPLREKCRSSPSYKKTPKAVKTVKEFLVKHMKIRDRDLNKIKIDSYLNEQLWIKGIKKPIYKVKVKAVKEGDLVSVYATDLPSKLKFKKLREEKGEIKAKIDAEKQKTLMEKAKESIKGKKDSKEDSKEESTEEKIEEEEKEETSKVAQEQIEKDSTKSMKHVAKPKSTKESRNAQVGYNSTSRGR